MGDITALILAKDKDICNILMKDIKKYVKKIIYIYDKLFENPISQTYAHSISYIVKSLSFSYIWAGSSSFIKETMPRVAARIPNSAMISDIQKVITNDIFERPMWAGDIIAQVKISSKIKIITIRPTDFQDHPKQVSTNITQHIAHEISSTNMNFLSFDHIKSERPLLSDASIVVSGGRGLKNVETFNKLLFPLADTLNAAVGASRAVCDADWVPNDWQVGQTGKIVAPTLYFAIGISEAIQHVAGMRGSKTIIAINKDIEAPIFQVSDYG